MDAAFTEADVDVGRLDWARLLVQHGLNKSPKCRQCLDYWQPRKRRYFAHLDHFRNDVGLFSLGVCY